MHRLETDAFYPTRRVALVSYSRHPSLRYRVPNTRYCSKVSRVQPDADIRLAVVLNLSARGLIRPVGGVLGTRKQHKQNIMRVHTPFAHGSPIELLKGCNIACQLQKGLRVDGTAQSAHPTQSFAAPWSAITSIWNVPNLCSRYAKFRMQGHTRLVQGNVGTKVPEKSRDRMGAEGMFPFLVVTKFDFSCVVYPSGGICKAATFNASLNQRCKSPRLAASVKDGSFVALLLGAVMYTVLVRVLPLR